MGLDRNIAAVSRIPVSESNNPKQNCHDQDDLLKHYKNKHEEDKCLFLQFMEHDNSSPSSPNKKYPQRKTKFTDFLIDRYLSKTNIRAIVKPPKNYEVVCVNDESLSVITSGIHANNTTTISQTSNVSRKKEKDKFINK